LGKLAFHLLCKGGADLVKLAVIADDLTGANDTGVQFAKQGLKTTVLFSDTHLNTSFMSGDVIVLNSESRALENEKAYETVYKLTEHLNEFGVPQILKKIDSTLRGNIGTEIDAVMDVYEYHFAFVVPAFPKNNRRTVNGIHYVDRTPIAETEIAKDPTCPLVESHLPTLLKSQSRREIGWIGIEEVKKGSTELSKVMNGIISDDIPKIIVIDAATDEDLKTISEAANQLKSKYLWVGSAGIAYYICEHVNRSLPKNIFKPISRLPVLLVAGSISSVTQMQIDELKRKRSIHEMIIKPEKFFKEEERQEEIDRVVQAGAELLQNGDLVVTTNREKSTIDHIKSLQKSLHLANGEVGSIIAQSMGEIASRLIQERKIQGAVLTGGDIAAATCKMLNGQGIEVIGEIENGIPYGRLIGGNHNGLSIITKAGAFGTDQAFVKALQALTETENPACI
jgi:D-threonate/D-erythronate kinase